MKASTLLRRAAERAYTRKAYGCHALGHLSDGWIPDEAMDYFSLTEPRGCEVDPTRSGWFGLPVNPEFQQHRVMALLLASEIARSEGR